MSPYADPEEYRAYQRGYYVAHQDHLREKARVYAQTEAGRASHQRALRAQKAQSPEKAVACSRVSQEIRMGRLAPQACEMCGSAPTQAHHAWGYSPEMALAVWWLCVRHHVGLHKALSPRRMRKVVP